MFLIIAVTSGRAQQTPAITSSQQRPSLVMNADSQQRFFAAHGRRALIDGYSTGGLEAWVYPFQIFRDYRITFRERGAATSVEATSILSRTEYQPDSVTRIYLGPGFTVREKLFVPLDAPGAVITYSIQGAHSIGIEVHATPVLNLMWPAAVGGQSVAWNADLKAFVLAEPAYGYSAVVGSPQIVAHDDPGNGTLQGADGPPLNFILQPETSGIATVFIALNPPHASDRGALFSQMIHDGGTLEAESAAHWNRFSNSVLKVTTPDEEVNRAIAWSEIALDQAWVCNPDLGCGYVAGYGPTRAGRRPQYDWFFAGDGLIATDASISAGNLSQAHEELEFILHYQDPKTGMIWHELSQSASFLDWAGKYPYMYVHVDISFQFLPVLARYVETSGDLGFARDHWQAIEAVYRYCASTIDPATQLPRIPADKEGGNEQDRQSDDLGLSTAWVEASAAFAQLAALTGHPDLGDQATRASQAARASIPVRYWDSAQSYWISGHTLSGQPMPGRGSAPESALTLHLITEQQNAHVLDELASSSYQTDWGARSVPEGSANFDPASYSKGSVWPVHAASLATTFWSEHRPVTALALWRTIPPLVSLDSLGHIPEVLDGSVYRQQVESVPEQTWSSAGFIDATVHGLLGLEADSVAGRLVFAPRLPSEWNDLSLQNINLRNSSISLTQHRTAGELSLEIDNPGNPFQLDFAPDLPLGSKLLSASFNNHPVAAQIESHPQQAIAKAVLTVPNGSSRLRLELSGGIAVLVPAPHPQLGDVSSGIFIVNAILDGDSLVIGADVPADQISSLLIQTARKLRNTQGATAESTAPNQIEVTLAAIPNPASPYRRAHVTLEFEP
jgi:glycogen debranching enzyme